MVVPARTSPDWDALYGLAEAQRGYFRASQAAEAGYSPQLLAKYLRNGRVVRARRGVYRLVHFPASENEDLVELWLWSDRVGVFSHDTALALHGLTDALPAMVHMTVPRSWRRRHIVVPSVLVLHYADLGERDRGWTGAVPVTVPARTLRDAIEAGVDPTIIAAAARDGVQRNLLAPAEVRHLVRDARKGGRKR